LERKVIGEAAVAEKVNTTKRLSRANRSPRGGPAAAPTPNPRTP
jgi:hypothetical protein